MRWVDKYVFDADSSEKRVPLNLSLNTEQNAMSDIRISRQERDDDIKGIDARELLKNMKKIVADAEAKDGVAEGKAVVDG